VLPLVVVDFALPLEMEPAGVFPDVVVEASLVLVVVLSPELGLVVEVVLVVVGVTPGLVVVVVVPEAAGPTVAASAA
jgi:hypothetical protein